MLRTFLCDGGELGIRDVARRLGYSPAAVYRTVATLVQHEFLEQNIENRRYRMSMRHTNGLTDVSAQVERIAAEELAPLAREHGLCAFLGVRQGKRVIYLQSLIEAQVICAVPRGATAHLHSTALGKALLASLSEPQCSDLIDRLPLPRLTNQTIVDPKALRAECATARRRGYAIADREDTAAFLSAGTWIRSNDPTRHVGISLSLPAADASAARRLDELCELSLRARDAISRRLSAHVQSTARIN